MYEWGSPELKNQGGAASDTVTVHDTGLVLAWVLVALSTCFYFADVRMFYHGNEKVKI